MPVIYLNEEKKPGWKDKLKNVVKGITDYVKENPEQSIMIASGVAGAIGGATKLVKSVNRHKQLRQEQFHRDRQVYDRRLGMYLTTNRKLKKADYDRVNAIRRKTGQSTGEVLSALGLLEK